MNVITATERVGKGVLDITEDWGRSWISFGTLIAIVTPPYRPYLFLTQLVQIEQIQPSSSP